MIEIKIVLDTSKSSMKEIEIISNIDFDFHKRIRDGVNGWWVPPVNQGKGESVPIYNFDVDFYKTSEVNDE